eukprot:5729162-Alexandrium_andersonii.AAC.1
MCAHVQERRNIVFVVFGKHHTRTHGSRQLIPVRARHRGCTRQECTMSQPAPCPAQHLQLAPRVPLMHGEARRGPAD